MINNRIKIILTLVCLIIAVYGIYIYVAHHNKTRVELVIDPPDATVKVDGKLSSGGTHYLSYGRHSFSADKNGFRGVTSQLVLGKESQVINLFPEPASQEAERWLSQNPKSQLKRQAAGDQESTKINQELMDNSPIISHLPLGYNQQQFAIDYSQSSQDPTKITLQITAESPTARQYALQKIRDWGYDPTDYKIDFLNFTNPLAGDIR